MSHQRFPSHEVKEPHSVSLKVLRLSRPSLVPQFPIHPPVIAPSLTSPIAGAPAVLPPARHLPPLPASLAYSPLGPIKKHGENGQEIESAGNGRTVDGYYNTEPFILSPIVNLPPSFGSAYVGETFSCTLCANHNAPPIGETSTAGGVKKTIRDVKIEAEMQTPSGQTTNNPRPPPPFTTLQKILNFGLKEEGTHVLGVTVSYYEATETSGRTRAFRKMYQFICKPSLIVRTKAGPLPSLPSKSQNGKKRLRRWVLEAQLENCSEDAILLEKVKLAEVQRGLKWRDCNNWLDGVREEGEQQGKGNGEIPKRPFLHPGESEQLCFIIEERDPGEEEGEEEAVPEVEENNGRIEFGVMALVWRTEMGNRGSLLTLKLGTKHVKPR
ncbi:hypothetical protein B0T20DRAFT_415497 [Sordaria brevicollis]|uniref:DUF974 domain-containing protein n=1 Tax=Sordaria brevicollis TaxID=83679 RepID=A0AAE0UB95_SORBR|nr:hypothetical protein B0T20DRAFT_415497 [Sordaria brevicollis]